MLAPTTGSIGAIRTSKMVELSGFNDIFGAFICLNCSIISEIVDAAIRENNNVECVDDKSVNSVFLNILNEKDLDIRDKKSAIIDFIAAGIETLANTLIFVLHYVTNSRNGILQRIQEEFDHCGTEIDSNDLAQAVYTKACLQETFRICPTAFCLARILQEDANLSGYDVKAGVKRAHSFQFALIYGNLCVC